jgi:regulator of RNase E activity RraA
VIVLDNGGRDNATVWGDILTEIAQRRGIAGTVIDGVCRDVALCTSIGYPVFSKDHWMRTGKDRVQVEATNVTVNIGDARVQPGDIVRGDADGVVVIPKQHEAQVLDTAEASSARRTRSAKRCAAACGSTKRAGSTATTSSRRARSSHELSGTRRSTTTRRDIDRVSGAVVAAARALPTATLHEAGGKIGALPSIIKPIASSFRCCGPALTVHSPGGDNLWLHRALDIAQPGDVLVVHVSGAYDHGYWGEIMTTMAKARGWPGSSSTAACATACCSSRSAFRSSRAGCAFAARARTTAPSAG